MSTEETVKAGAKSSEFWLLIPVLTIMVESPDLSWQVTATYVAYAGARALVKIFGTKVQ